jgi:hypothetical protein
MNPPSPVGEGWPPLASFALGEGEVTSLVGKYEIENPFVKGVLDSYIINLDFGSQASAR